LTSSGLILASSKKSKKVFTIKFKIISVQTKLKRRANPHESDVTEPTSLAVAASNTHTKKNKNRRKKVLKQQRHILRPAAAVTLEVEKIKE